MSLPPVAFIDNPYINDAKTCRRFPNTTAPVIAVARDEAGFHPIHTRASADELNAEKDVTVSQREAMLHGSMFGFDTPGADPEVQARLLARRVARNETPA